MVLSKSKPVNPPRTFIPIDEAGRIMHNTDERKASNRYYMIDFIGNDIAISKVQFTWYGCSIIDINGEELTIIKNKYKNVQNNIPTTKSIKEREIRGLAVFVKKLFRKTSQRRGCGRDSILCGEDAQDNRSGYNTENKM